MKLCSRCKNEKEASYFSIDKNMRSGLSSWCKQCRKEYDNSPEMKEKRRKYHSNDEVKKKRRENYRLNGGAEKNRIYRSSPDRILARKERDKKRHQSEDYILYRKKYQSTEEYRIYQWEKNINNHGLTVEDYNKRLKLQNEKCKICQTEIPGGRGSWHIDHDHSCCPGNKSCDKCVRGLLCNNCNVGLGYFRDNPVFVHRATDYLLGYLSV